MTPTSEYKKWLEAVCNFFDLSEYEVLKPAKHSEYARSAKNIFYWLCFKEGIDLYRLSECLGKHRTTVIASIKKSDKPDKEILNKIWAYVKFGEPTEGVELPDECHVGGVYRSLEEV